MKTSPIYVFIHILNCSGATYVNRCVRCIYRRFRLTEYSGLPRNVLKLREEAATKAVQYKKVALTIFSFI